MRSDSSLMCVIHKAYAKQSFFWGQPVVKFQHEMRQIIG